MHEMDTRTLTSTHVCRLSVSPVTDVTDLAAVLTGGKRKVATATKDPIHITHLLSPGSKSLTHSTKVTTAVAKPEARDEEEEDLHYKLVRTMHANPYLLASTHTWTHICTGKRPGLGGCWTSEGANCWNPAAQAK